MLSLQYELGHSPINIYLDRPNLYLSQLTEINVRLFIVGQAKFKIPKEYRHVEYITPDISPNIVLSQTKLENFEILGKFSSDYHVPFIHLESNYLPELPASKIEALKCIRPPISIFTNKYLIEEWQFDEEESEIIEYGIDAFSKSSDGSFYISGQLPLYKLAEGTIPICPNTPYNAQYIKNSYNGFLFNNREEIGGIVSRLERMDKEDLIMIGNNAKEILKKFSKANFFSKWKSLFKRIII